MSYEEFWEESPYLVITFRKAFRLKRELMNEEAWLEGMYFYAGVSTALANVFRKKGQKIHNYLEKPIDIFPLTKAEKKRREREEYEKINAQLQQLRQNQIARKRKEEKSKEQGGE